MKYTPTLDLIVATFQLAHDGKFEKAAACLDKVLKMKDVASVIESLDKMNAKAFADRQAATATTAAPATRSTALAKALEELAAAKKKKPAAKKVPFGGKKAAPFGKKKAKADLDTDETFDEVTEDMVVDADAVVAPDAELNLDELNLDDISEDLEEMPVADVEGDEVVDEIDLDGEGVQDGLTADTTVAAEDEDEGEDDEAEDEADDKEDEEEKKDDEGEGKSEAKANLSRALANLTALDRLTKKPAK